MVVNPAKHPHVKKDLAQAVRRLGGLAAGQDAIATYKIGGEQLFFPERRSAAGAVGAHG